MASSRIDLDQSFTSYCRYRDPELLGRVFEATAPLLLRRARRLVGDARAAEDLVQEVFLSVLDGADNFDVERPCLPYLVGVLKWRAVAHCRRRWPSVTAAVDEFEAAPAGESVHFAETRNAVRLALAELAPPYREVVQLYLEAHLTPREIGKRLDRSAGTVRVQLHRGLARLRLLLPPGLAVLLSGLLAAQLPPRASASSPVRARIPPRSLAWRAPLAIACGLVLVLGAVSMQLRSDIAAVPRPDAPTAATAAADPPAALRRADVTPTPSARRTAAVASATASRLEVEVVWASDGTPASRVGATLRVPGQDEDFGVQRAHCDAAGRLRFDAPRGEVLLGLDRGVQRELHIGDGALRLRIAVPDEHTVRGRVVDGEGRPVAHAALWISDRPRHVWSGQVVGHAGADGSFTLRGVQPQMHVTAWAPDLAPAPLQTIDVQTSSPLEFELSHGGATLTGIVADPHGAPVRGAIVHVGSHARDLSFLRGASARLDPTRLVRTDANGAFRIDSLRPGQQTFAVRHPHFAPASREAQVVAGQVTHVALRLRAGRSLRGSVELADGAPVAGAVLQATGLDAGSWAAALTASDGSFTLAGLSDDAVTLAVTAVGYEPIRAQVAAGVSTIALTAQPVPHVSGHVLGRIDGEHWQVCLDRGDRSPSDGPPPTFAVADDGSFGAVVPGGFDVDHVSVSCREQPIWLRCAAELDARGQLVVQVPSTFAQRGRLLVPLDGVTADDVPHLRLLAARDRWTYTLDATLTARGLEPEPLVPGEYELFVDSPGMRFPSVPLGPCQITADCTTTAPTLGGERGELAFSFARDGEPPRELTAWVTDGCGVSTKLHGFAGRCALRPGNYTLSALTAECAPIVERTFTIGDGSVTQLAIALLRGHRCELRWQADDGAPVSCEVLDERGRQVLQVDRTPHGSGSVSLPIVLGAGSHRLRTRSRAGVESAPFVVRPSDHLQVVPLYPVGDGSRTAGSR